MEGTVGYSTRGSITDFTPDNDVNTLYISANDGYTFDELLERAKAHFGQDISMEELNIRAEKIHTHYIYYDRYDPGDWTNYIVIERVCETV
jgi:hypothetical protein